MLTLNDGRNELWQWDTGRKLTVDADCSQVHFSNKVFGRSVDVDAVDGVAIIPDILLQTDKDLTAWAFVGTPKNGYTKISKVFKVNKRNKPADYVFTPPEQTTLGELVERLDKIEECQDPDAIKNAVEDYLQNNPIHVDEKDPTVPEWAKQNDKPKYTAAEVGALPSTTNIPIKTSELTNDSGFVNNTVTNLVNYYLKTETYSKEEVRQLISAIPKFSIKPVSKLPTTDISETTIYLVPGGDGDDLYTEYIHVSGKWEILGSQKMDLTGYAKETYVKDYAQPKGNYLTEVPEGYATEEFVKNKIAEAELGGEEVDLSGYAQKSELPTKVSQLQNDSGYLTAVPEEYAKTADIPTKPSDIGAQPEGDYALRSEIPSVPVKSVNGKTGAVSLTATDVKARPDSWMPTASDVGALPSSTVIPIVPTELSAFTNDVGYLTKHQDISGKLDASALPTAINTALAQANASGEFDGKDGTSVTVKSVTESTADGGSNVVQFSDGKTLTVKNGKQGTPGKNPVKGIDFWTDADKAAMVQEVIDTMGGAPIFGVVDANKDIVITGDLEDGTYTLKYKDAEGKTTEIGKLVLSNIVTVPVTFSKGKIDSNTGSISTGSINDYFYSTLVDVDAGYSYSLYVPAGLSVTAKVVFWDGSGAFLKNNTIALWDDVTQTTTTKEANYSISIPSGAKSFRLRIYNYKYQNADVANSSLAAVQSGMVLTAARS